MNVFGHDGDLGDLIASLPTARAMDGGWYVISLRKEGRPGGMTRETLKGARFDAIKPLLEAQPYVNGVEWQDEAQGVTHEFSTFRQDYRKGESLAHWQARHLSVDSLDTSPWLHVRPNEAYRGRVIFARSSRYANGHYPWFALLKRYPDALFVGMPSEHEAFQHEFSCKVQYVPCGSLLELAALIAGARLFCGNQSCPWWIACGLGVPSFQETWQYDANSIIERANCHYMTGPLFDLEKLPI